MKQVIIYTDGACRGNPGPGGWGALIKFDSAEKEIFGGQTDTTNNQMELSAAIEGLAILKESCSVELFTDSKYVMDGITQWIQNWKKNNWRTAAKKDVKNKELWTKIRSVNFLSSSAMALGKGPLWGCWQRNSRLIGE